MQRALEGGRRSSAGLGLDFLLVGDRLTCIRGVWREGDRVALPLLLHPRVHGGWAWKKALELGWHMCQHVRIEANWHLFDLTRSMQSDELHVQQPYKCEGR